MFIRTERLLLRPGWAEDAPALAAAIASERIVRNLVHAPWPYRPYHAEAFLALPFDLRHPALLVFERGDDALVLVGGCALARNEAGDAELGYWIAEKRWGRGYATEAARAVLATAAGLGHRRVVSGHFTDNPASGAVLAKLGFRRTGTVQRASLARGGRSEMVTMALGGEEERPAGPCDLPMAA